MCLNDARHGTHVVDELLVKYKAAWEKKGMVGANGLYPDAWMEKQDRLRPASDPAWTAWAGAMMNAWNSDLVRSLYNRQSMGYLTTINGQTLLHPPALGNSFRDLVEKDDASPTSAETLQKARERSRGEAKPRFPYTKPMFGYVVEWLSELGKKTELDSLLQFADEKLSPTWEHGGLYYPRHDEPFDSDLNWTHMDPFTGNAAIGYARLNVEDGVKKMWDAPWTAKALQNRPWVDGVGLEQGVDFLRACWDKVDGCLVLTARSCDQSRKRIKPVFRNLQAGPWELHISGQSSVHEIEQGGELAFELDVGQQEVDVVAVKQ